jgi:pyruvate/2-oxoglutarate dehydrogenase complex dihydrolipoamide dehydrogenase (E3) component
LRLLWTHLDLRTKPTQNIQHCTFASSKSKANISHKHIKKIAVLGSGLMGTGIACHLAGCGYEVLMLDILPPTLKDGETSKGAFKKNSAVLLFCYKQRLPLPPWFAASLHFLQFKP